MTMNGIQIADPWLRRIVYTIGVMGLIALGFYTFSLLKEALALVLNVLTPFIVALLMAYILAPAVIALQQQLRLGRVMGTLALYLIIFLVVFLLLAFLIPKLISEFIKLFDVIKNAIPGLMTRLAESEYLQLEQEAYDVIQAKLKELTADLDNIAAQILPGLKKVASGGIQAVGKATKGIFSGVGWIFGVFSFLAFVGIINFYYIVDWEKIRPLIRKMVPPARRERAFDILDKMDVAVGGFLRGQLTVSLLVGLMFAVGLFCMGFIGFPGLRNYCILIGTAAAVGGFIPYLGAVIGVTPAILIILLTGGIPWSTKIIALAGVLALFSAIQAVEGFILQPKIVGKGAGLHPLVVMLALIFGAQFGLIGMIIAVPGASVIRVLIREFYWLPIERREAERAGDRGA